MHRRNFLQTLGAAGLASTFTNAGLSFANAPTDSRLVFIVLRGALDGLHALVPYADKNYKLLRPKLALGGPDSDNNGHKGVINLDGYFGLHPALSPLHKLYLKNELLLIPASATKYRSRSHFDGQNMLENGSGKPFGAKDGWLNRAIVSLNDNDRRLGLSLGPTIPLIMQGNALVQTWSESGLPEADEDFLERVSYTYKNDPLFSKMLKAAKESTKPENNMSALNMKKGKANKDFVLSTTAAADLLANPKGPRIAVMEMQGWDTHHGQHYRLNKLLNELANGIVTLKTGLGPAWKKTAIVVVSEFGRTAAENGSAGTDHGVGGLAMLAGGAVKGGNIGGIWPGLGKASLYEGRDVTPTTDYESIFKSVLNQHLGLKLSKIEDHIFPSSSVSKPMENLFKI